MASENQLPPRPPIITLYENRQIDHRSGNDEDHSPEMASPESVRGDVDNQLDLNPGKEPDEPEPRPSAIASQSRPELPAFGTDLGKSLVQPESSVRYRLEPGEELVYAFDIHAELGSQKYKYQGRNTIQATGNQANRNRVTNSITEDRVNESSGTGFIIHPDGFVVTCAHVVIGATRIRVLVDGTERTATVIKLDQENDLAVLRLEGGNFPYLKFAHSDKVRLGQEARAVGYPLADVLGETIKVTRGEVSGLGGPAGTDGIQIDATINPGNSGGPLVDNSGRVIGITSSLLVGIGVSEVGFAVPSNRVIEVAEQLGITVEVAEEASDMTAPEVIDLVSPSTVLLKVTSGPDGIGIDPPHELKFSGYCYARMSPTSGLLHPPSHQHEHLACTIDVEPSGQLLDDRYEARLPFALGKASLVGIERLPRLAPGHSISNSLVVIQEGNSQQDNFVSDPYGLASFSSRRRPPWMRLPSAPITRTRAMIGKESTIIALGKRASEGIDVTKTYSVQFGDDAKNEAPIAITGSGKGRFDPDAGRMLTMNYKMTVTVNQENLTLRIPIAMNYKLLTADVLDAERLARKEREEARQKEKAAKSEAMGFRSAKPSGANAAEEPLYQKVKDAPQTSNLSEFDPDQ